VQKKKHINTDEKIFASLGFDFFPSSAQVCFYSRLRPLRLLFNTLQVSNALSIVFLDILTPSGIGYGGYKQQGQIQTIVANFHV